MQDRAAIQRARAWLFSKWECGEVAAWVDRKREFRGLSAVAPAVEYMLSGASIGKVVVSL